MLKEYKEVRQHEEGFRRYFFDEYFDLYFWYDRRGGNPRGFQLVYDKYDDPHSLTWTREEGFRHNRVDEGEDKPGSMKMTPILVPDGLFDGDRVRRRFWEASASLDPSLRELVLSGVSVFSSGPGGRKPSVEPFAALRREEKP